jgi:formylglycine-generating enzyme required for sulfatase activity
LHTDGTVKISDFGLVRMVGEQWLHSQVQQSVARSMSMSDRETVGPSGASGQARSTSSGQAGTSSKALLGTYAYMSPEQKDGGAVDHRSDLYAVGLMAFQMLTGEKTPGFELPSALVDGLDPAWDDWVRPALAARPDRRFASAEAMLKGLPGAAAAEPAKKAVAAEKVELSQPVVEAKAPQTTVTEPAMPPVVEAHRPTTRPSVAARSCPVPGQNAEVELPGGVKMDLVWIRPGEFVMGSPERITKGWFLGIGQQIVQEGEEGRYGDEGPQTRVRLTRGFWLGKYPVMQGQWRALMENNPSHFTDSGLNAPVEGVSWDEAMEFARHLTEQERRAGRLPEGYVYTLPSEAQWEYACRAGTTTRFNLGDSESDLHRAGWFDGNSGDRTYAVGQKTPNAWGLYDMHGNVWEWTRSYWQGNHPGGSVVDYEGPSSGRGWVGRGGGWGCLARGCRSARRNRWVPGDRSVGFRLALAPSP